MKKQLKQKIKRFIKKNYGESEAQNPCYDVGLLAQELEKFINKNRGIK